MINEGREHGGVRVHLLRHGDSRQDGVKRYVGRTDLPLNEKGRAQAAQWRTELSGITFSRCYSSSLLRSVETARIILGALADGLTVLPGLGEISMGRWDGLPMEEVRREFPDEYMLRGVEPALHRPPDGESFNDLRDRIVPLFETILRENEGPILVVGHAGVNRVILCHLLGMPLNNIFRLGQNYGCMNVIVSEKGSRRVEVMNCRPWMGISSGCPNKNMMGPE